MKERNAARAPMAEAGGTSMTEQVGRPDVENVNCGTVNRNPSQMSFFSLIREDFATHERDFFAQGFWALFWHRFGNWRMSIKTRPLRLPATLVYKMGAKLSQWLCGIDLPYTVKVGRRVKLEHFGGMILVAREIGDEAIVRQNTTFGISRVDSHHGRPTIGNGVDIGAGVAILGDITIGENCVIGANSVVLQSFPANTVIGGVPARILKEGIRK